MKTEVLKYERDNGKSMKRETNLRHIETWDMNTGEWDINSEDWDNTEAWYNHERNMRQGKTLETPTQKYVKWRQKKTKTNKSMSY